MSFISKTALFRGCSEEDIHNMSEHLNFRTNRYRKGNVIFGTGSIVTDIGLVLSGSVRIEHTDLWGNKSILGITPAGGVFAESKTVHTLFGLWQPKQAYSESCHDQRRKKPTAFQAQSAHITQDNTWTAVFLFYTAGFCTG